MFLCKIWWHYNSVLQSRKPLYCLKAMSHLSLLLDRETIQLSFWLVHFFCCQPHIKILAAWHWQGRCSNKYSDIHRLSYLKSTTLQNYRGYLFRYLVLTDYVDGEMKTIRGWRWPSLLGQRNQHCDIFTDKYLWFVSPWCLLLLMKIVPLV